MKIFIAAAIVAFSSSALVVHADDMQRQACMSDAECTADIATVFRGGPGDYCSTIDNTCVAAGECTALEDCTENMSNIFAVPMCLGDMYCIFDAGMQNGRGRCANICMGTPSTCDAYDACANFGLLGDCCPTAEGQFLACCVADGGTAEEDPIATDPDDSPAEDDSLMNEMMLGDNDAVPGIMPTDPTADGGTDENPDSPVVCAADSECNASPELDIFYCAAGTCLPQGGCLLDTDCVNPSNYGIQDTRCVGYLFCDTTSSDTKNPVCARKCTGFQCPGDVPATTCSVTGCDTRIACQGSVNCVVDQCDAECKGIFFDSAGTVLEECTGGKGGAPFEPDEEEEYEGEGVSMVGEPLLFTMAPTDADADADAAQCASDRDCEAFQELDALYCAAGTCLPQGACLVDTDCVNPSNYGIQDTRCVGYLYCDTNSADNIVTPMCARKCTGFQCPGDVPATECSVTGCDTRIACQGSVNCVVDNCDADCKGIFFDSAGTVLEECTGGKGSTSPEPEEYKGEGVSMVGEPLLFTMAPATTDVAEAVAVDTVSDGCASDSECPPSPNGLEYFCVAGTCLHVDVEVEVDTAASAAAETGGEEGVSMVGGEPLVQTISPTPADVEVDTASAAGAESTATATVTTTTAETGEATTTTTTTTTADDGTGTPVTTATMDAAEAETASSATTVRILRSGLLFAIVVVAMTSGLVVGLI